MIPQRQIRDDDRLASTHFQLPAAQRAGDLDGRDDVQSVRPLFIAVAWRSDRDQAQRRWQQDAWDTMHAVIMPQIAFCALLHLAEVTHSVQPQDQRRSFEAPRAFAPWTREELELFRALLDHGVTRTLIARVLERTENALDFAFEGKRVPDTLTRYPLTQVRLCQRDLDLLSPAALPPLPRDQLHWAFGDALPAYFSEPAAAPTLRVIEVHPDTLTAPWRPGRNDEGFWAAYRQDADAAAQAVWMDLAGTLTLRGDTVLIAPPDLHSKRLNAVRAALKLTLNQTVPRTTVQVHDRISGRRDTGTVVLLDQSQHWSISGPTGVRAKTVIVVVPALGPLQTVKFALPPERPLLPHAVRYRHVRHHPDQWKEWAADEQAQRTIWLKEVAQGRRTERLSFTGLPNTAGVPARIDWPSLGLIPERGAVVAADDLLLTRAAVWYSLATHKLPDAAEHILRPSFDRTALSPSLASAWHDTVAPTLSEPSERLRQRVLLDCTKLPTTPSLLQMRVVQVSQTAYLGR